MFDLTAKTLILLPKCIWMPLILRGEREGGGDLPLTKQFSRPLIAMKFDTDKKAHILD